MNDKQLVRDVRNTLANYKHYIDLIHRWEDERKAIIEEMIKTSGSIIKPPDVQKVLDIHRNTPLWEKYYDLKRKINTRIDIITQIKKFVSNLESDDRKIFDKLYFSNIERTEEQVAKQHSRSRRGLQERVKTLIINNWEY